MRGFGFLTTRSYTDLMDRFIRSLFLQAGFKERAKEILEEIAKMEKKTGKK